MMVGHGLVMVSRAHVRFIPSTEMNMALVEKLKAEPCVRVCGQVGRGGLELIFCGGVSGTDPSMGLADITTHTGALPLRLLLDARSPQCVAPGPVRRQAYHHLPRVTRAKSNLHDLYTRKFTNTGRAT